VRTTLSNNLGKKACNTVEQAFGVRFHLLQPVFVSFSSPILLGITTVPQHMQSRVLCRCPLVRLSSHAADSLGPAKTLCPHLAISCASKSRLIVYHICRKTLAIARPNCSFPNTFASKSRCENSRASHSLLRTHFRVSKLIIQTGKYNVRLWMAFSCLGVTFSISRSTPDRPSCDMM
jgi:hypothetical protein